MLAIRLQRTGRSRHAQFRVIVQDSRFSPVRGRVTAYLGSYDPHTKEATIDSEKAAQYLQNGAQPSDRVARLLQKEGVKLPDWVSVGEAKSRTVRHPEKRRSTRPAEPEAPAETPAEATPEEPAAEAPQIEEPAAETPAEDAPEATPAEEPAVEAEPAAETPAEAPGEPEAPAQDTSDTEAKTS